MGEDAIDEVFETYEKYTTMMYRPPEMIDKYRRFNVSTKVDIWVSRKSSQFFAVFFSQKVFNDFDTDWLLLTF